MAEQEIILTIQGLKRLEEELEYLRTVRRQQVAERIRQAIEFGDISENSEYEEAKNEQAFIEGRIITLEKKLRQAKLLDQSEVSTEVVTLGSWVRLRDLVTGEESEYEIVGSMEADPNHHRISNLSPVGRALLGQKAGSIVEVNAPAGIQRYEILAIRG
ncbi:MAG: transcription elongation factor GreA [Clostridia bacterium]|nr:transcription elongation factor GreA [Clostridia bacterium]